MESPSIWFAMADLPVSASHSPCVGSSARHGRSAFGCRSDLFEPRAPRFRRPSVAGSGALVVAVVVTWWWYADVLSTVPEDPKGS